MTLTTQRLVGRAKADVRHLSPAEVEAHLLAEDVTLIDVREREELDEHGWIAGAIHLPRGLLEFRADPSTPLYRPEFSQLRLIIVYDAVGDRAALAAETLAALGHRDVAYLAGGLDAWIHAGLPVVGLKGWHDLGRLGH
jgi:rhodanese-related sulfurtransferase